MSEADTAWSRLASRVTRVVLTRKDFTYASLVQALSAHGVHDHERAIVARISRGTLKLSFFLQIVAITGVRPPERWIEALGAAGDSWEARARAVCKTELARQPSELSNDLAARLARIGTAISAKSLDMQLESGSISLSLFLQLLYLLNADSLERYIDHDDLVEAARATSAALGQAQ
ncbi:DUF6471 domain-containing protein [Paraburkholderia youngii]|uniref:DUF6471 domain-containing protein n=1 Tax=Paraburkholderia youngii TaxID=2782701 RepID=UPI003D1B1DAC